MRLDGVTWKKAWALLVAFAVTLALCVVPDARAQDDSDEQNAIDAAPLVAAKTVEFGAIQISRVLGNPDDSLRQWEFAAFDFDWKAPEGVIKGQKFTVRYPDGFHLYGNEIFQLKSKEGEIGGDCHVRSDNQSVTCVFNDEFEGRLDVYGSLHTEVQAQKATSESHVDMTIDGVGYRVALPGAGGIVGVVDHAAGELHKQGWYNDDYTTSGWRVDIPGSLLVEAGGARVTVTDSLSGHPHRFDVNQSPKITAHTVRQNGDRQEVDAQVGEQAVLGYKVSVDGKTATYEISPPNASAQWEPGLLYRVRYTTKTEDGKPAPKDVGTTNTVVINSGSKEFMDQETIKNWQSSRGTIHGVKKASYEVKKALADPEMAELIPANTMFTVKAHITTPDGKQRAEEIQVSLDGNTSGPTELPEGSIVELSEVNTPEIPGVTFGEPRFSADDGQNGADLELLEGDTKVRFTTVASRNIKVMLTNTIAGANAPFAVVKKASGIDDAAEHEFKFAYSCKVGGKVETGEVMAKGDGVPVLSDKEFPVGTECVVTEDVKAATKDGYRLITEPQSLKRTVKIGTKENVVQANFVNTYARMVGGLAITKEMSTDALAELMGDQEFSFEATWELHGTTEQRRFTLRAGDVFSDFPKLPLGTKVTVRELLPEDSPWETPIFKGNVGGAVEDHGDGSATITVLSQDAELLITVINNTGSGLGGFGWLSLLSVIPLLGTLTSPSAGSVDLAQKGAAPAGAPRSPGGPPPGMSQEASEQPKRSVVRSDRQLAQTGASVLGIVVIAVIVIAVGVYLIRNGRRK